MATLRGLGAVLILAWVSPTIQAFFLWQVLISTLTLGTLGAVTYGSLPRLERMSRFSLAALRSVWRFAGGMLIISFLALLLMQVDKVLLSKLLTLSDYGAYAIATAVAGALYTLILPITQAFYPRLCELHACGNNAAMIRAFHKSAQLVSVLAGSAAVVVIIFSETFLRLWTQNQELAAVTAPLLSVLMLGNLLNGLMWIPYHTQLAHGWTSLTIKINVIAVIIIVPAILWATPRYGAEGAAWVWASINAVYVLVGMNFMFRKVLTTEKRQWYIHDLFMPMAAAVAVALLIKTAWEGTQTTSSDLLLLSVSSVFTLGSALLAAGRVRNHGLRMVKNWWVYRKLSYGS
jgi:O-antigen/teichoic acid export membrane protein